MTKKKRRPSYLDIVREFKDGASIYELAEKYTRYSEEGALKIEEMIRRAMRKKDIHDW